MSNHTLQRRLATLLRSRKLAYLLILLLTIATIAGVLTPRAILNEDLRYERLRMDYPVVFRLLEASGLENYYTSVWYQALVALLFINTMFCTVEQWKKAALEAGQASIAVESGGMEVYGFDQSSVLALLRKNRYHTEQISDKDGRTVLVARRGRFGLFGSPLFHVFLLVLIVGVLLSGLTRSYGYLVLAEGETLPVAESSFIAVNNAPYARRGSGEVLVSLDKLDVDYDSRGFPFRFASTVVFEQRGIEPQVKKVEQVAPTPFSGYNFYQLERGYAPLVLLLDENDVEVWGAFLYLETIPGPDGELYLDELTFPFIGADVIVELLPDGRERRVGEGPWPHRPEAPALNVVTPDNGAVVIPLGEGTDVAGMTLAFPELRQWSGMNVVRDPGLPVIAAGFTGIVAGLCLLFFLSYQRLQIRIDVETVYITEVRRREKILPLPDLKKMFMLSVDAEGDEQDAGL